MCRLAKFEDYFLIFYFEKYIPLHVIDIPAGMSITCADEQEF